MVRGLLDTTWAQQDQTNHLTSHQNKNLSDYAKDSWSTTCCATRGQRDSTKLHHLKSA